jgi:hypothetical protein
VERPSVRLTNYGGGEMIGALYEEIGGPLGLEVRLAAFQLEGKPKLWFVFQGMGDSESVEDPIWPETTT